MKRFLKPTRSRIFLAVLIFLFLPVFRIEHAIICKQGPCPPNIGYISLIALAGRGFAQVNISLLTALGAAVSYLAASMLTTFWKSGTASHFAAIRKGLKVSRPKIILASLGWVAVFSIFLKFVAGIYGGTVSAPSILHPFYTFFDAIDILLAPFTIVTSSLFYLNVIILSSLGTFSSIPTLFVTRGILSPYSLTPVGAFIVLPLLVVEWYSISALISSAYGKARRKFFREH